MGVLICVTGRGRQACLVPVWEFRGQSLPEELVPIGSKWRVEPGAGWRRCCRLDAGEAWREARGVSPRCGEDRLAAQSAAHVRTAQRLGRGPLRPGGWAGRTAPGSALHSALLPA